MTALRVMFAVDDLDHTLARVRQHGAEVVDRVMQYPHAFRLCYIRGQEGILIGLAQELAPEPPLIRSDRTSRDDAWNSALSVTFTGWLGRLIARMMRGLNERCLAQEVEGLRRRSEDEARTRP